MSSDLYPLSPAAVPADFTAPTSRYRWRVAVVLFSLVAFLAVYVGLIAGALWVVSYCISQATQVSGRGSTGLILGGIVAAGFFAVFLIKGLFKRQRRDKSRMIELSRDDEPQLFAFLDRLIEETGAPAPKKVFVTPEVNAAVFYDISVLGLFWPVRKNLLIGLGLVNALNLSELKAVLAHELGHFSQRSMKVGTYVYIANRVIGDMVYARDSWDRALSSWASFDLRVAWPAWILIALVWVVRHALGLLFRVINILDAALSREMEFNADRVAVRAAGSDAIVHALKRLVFADACMNQTFADLSTAADHELYTRDLFYHQTLAAEHLRRVAQEPNLGVPPPVPATNPGDNRVFDADDDSAPSMWATHPCDRDREDNAKAVYLTAPVDERPAWSLFADPDALRAAATERIVRDALGAEITLSPPETVQAFIDQERAETTFDPRYHGIYDDRFVTPGELEAAFDAEPRPRAELDAAYHDLWDDAVASTMARHRELDQELQVLAGVLTGQRAGRSFRFRGDERPRADAVELVDAVVEERNQLLESLAPVDERVLRVHAEMARAMGGDWAAELRQRYHCQLALQALFDQLRPGRDSLEGAIDVLQSEQNIDEDGVRVIIEGCGEASDVWYASRSSAREVTLPALSNLDEGTSLAEFCFPHELVSGPVISGDEIQGQVIQSLHEAYGTAFGRLGRLFSKSMGGILALQEAIAARWAAGDA